MDNRIYRVLFLSQRNSARSLLAEAILSSLGKNNFEAFSAGVRPAETPDPIALELLEHAHLSKDGIQPKHYSEFLGSQTAPLDFVFTLSDTAAGEPVPEWPGSPVTAHWPSTDPRKLQDEVERRRALIRTRAELENRLRIFLSLPFATLDRLSMQERVNDIGRSVEKEPVKQRVPRPADADSDLDPPSKPASAQPLCLRHRIDSRHTGHYIAATLLRGELRGIPPFPGRRNGSFEVVGSARRGK